MQKLAVISVIAWAVTAAVACSGSKEPVARRVDPPAGRADAALVTPPSAPAAAGSADAAATAPPVAAPADRLAAPPPPPAPPPAPAGDDFAAQVQTLYAVGACGAPVPAADARFAGRAQAAHCRSMQAKYAAYRKAWADRARAFIAELRPADLPSTVVYPFGGGDLGSALVVFPDAQELTTLSLEAAGDVRTIDTVDAATLRRDLDTIGHDIGRLYKAAHSTTKSLMKASHSRLPGTIVFALAALAVHDLEPVSLRYFDLADDGAVVYLTGAELDRRAAAAVATARAAAPKPARGPRPKGTVNHFWREQESVFANIEITFRRRGDAGAPLRTYRHLAANLDDSHLEADPRVLRHLERKGKVAVMTKAASFLLWYDDFSKIRRYLLDHLAWMISDASGIPPSHAGPAGFEQITYGTFIDAYFIKDPKNTRREFIDLWKKNPRRPLPFRFGYPDAKENAHLMVTRPRT